MEILEIIKTRRSIRRFQSKEIEKEKLAKLVEALIWAPSAGNLQARKFYFVFNKESKEKLAMAASDQKFITQAPLVVVGCTDDEIEWKYGERGKTVYSICDVAMSVQNMMLLAVEQGLGTCPVGAFDEKEVKEILNLPKNLRPIIIVPVGYPAHKPSAPSRVSKEKVVEFIK
ncbi:nitroreductase family protein [Patescibacteria group bacterium]|nr:nitroreductase family protein [Patescibacteria group bacterium]